MNKQDRNTAIVVIIVLIVCAISIYALASGVWALIGPGVTRGLDALGYTIKIQTLDYNFAIPDGGETVVVTDNTPINPEPVVNNPEPVATDTEVAPTQNDYRVIPANYSYNFAVPKVAAPTDDYLSGFQDSILSDAQLAGYGSGSDVPQTNLNLLIPKININSPVIQGLGGDDLLEKGFWVHPISKPIGQGEMVVLCHRRYFGPYDPRSCWYLDKLERGDEIYLKGNSEQLTYKVIGVNIFDEGDPQIYQTSDTENYLRIVTCTPLYSNTQRLVVLAELVQYLISGIYNLSLMCYLDIQLLR